MSAVPTNPLKIAPSLLSADFGRLGEEIARVERAGCDWLHVDVMDGHFVPNLTVGPFIVKAIRRLTRLPLDVHLMIENPGKYVDAFADAGSDSITVHAEACQEALDDVIRQIREKSVRCGVSLRPASPLKDILTHLKGVDLVLLMTVNPGFGGQAFLPEVLPKIEALRRVFTGDIEVDGGINAETSRLAVKAGANVLVAGTAIFGQSDAAEAIRALRESAR